MNKIRLYRSRRESAGCIGCKQVLLLLCAGGSIVKGRKVEQSLTRTTGQQFYEDTRDIHIIARNVSNDANAFPSVLIQEKDPISLMPRIVASGTKSVASIQITHLPEILGATCLLASMTKGHS